MTVVTMVVRLDVYSLLYGLLLGTLLLLSRRVCAAIWPFYMVLLMAILLVQYLFCLGLPHGICWGLSLCQSASLSIPLSLCVSASVFQCICTSCATQQKMRDHIYGILSGTQVVYDLATVHRAVMVFFTYVR